MMAWIVAVLLLVGAVFMLLAAVGVLRFPDLYTRMHAATKAGTFGKVCLFLAVALFFADLGVTTRAAIVVVFFFLTAPIAAHRIGRAAYATGVAMWERSEAHGPPETDA